MPQLRDPNFHRTVVLLVHHDDEGTFGVVMNRPTEITARGLCSTLDMSWGGSPEKGIDWGGPVQPQTGWLVMGESSTATVCDEVKRLVDGVYFAGSLEVLRSVAAEPPDQLHAGCDEWLDQRSPCARRSPAPGTVESCRSS